MKQVWKVFICCLLLLCLPTVTGCGIIDNSVSISSIEADLGIDLGDLSEKKVQAVFKDVSGQTVIVRAQLLGWKDTLDAQLAQLDHWHPMPLDADTLPFLQEIPNLNLDLDSIRSGFWTAEAVSDETGANPTYKVGFWDSEGEYLYYFRVTIPAAANTEASTKAT